MKKPALIDMKPASVVIIGPAHPLRGGLATFNERLAREFRQEGAQVSIYTFSLQYPKILFPGKTQYSDEPAPADLEIKVCINSINPFNWIKIGNRLKKERPDIIIVRYWLPFMGPCLGTILRRVKKNKHTRIVCIADNILPHEKRPGDTLFTRYFVKPVDAFITMSEKVMQDLRRFSQKPARTVNHPLYDNFGEKVDKKTAREKLGIQHNGPLFLFFGFIRKYKGLDTLLDALYLIKKENPQTPLRLLVAGEFYEDEKPYLDQISKNELQDWLILKTNFIADSDVRYYLSAADCVIQPYRNATQSGVTPLAYHFEVPMIVTNVGGLPALVPDGRAGLVTEPDAVSLAKSINNFLSGDPLRFRDGLLNERKKYTWDKLTGAIVHLSHDV
jgi:glycosyltransferase involved in cell wall biosynthesis